MYKMKHMTAGSHKSRWIYSSAPQVTVIWESSNHLCAAHMISNEETTHISIIRLDPHSYNRPLPFDLKLIRLRPDSIIDKND